MGPGSHSPVGASAIKRVLKCPASVTLSAGIEDEESEHAALGTAVHTLIEHCFKEGKDGWELVGRFAVSGELLGAADVSAKEARSCVAVTKQMANSAQVMLDAVRRAHPDRNQGNFWIERRFHCPTIHKLFFGTSDVVHYDEATRTLHVWDYKNGVILVEVEANEQGMYYACGALEDLSLWDTVEKVVIHIVQPNGFHSDGAVREWETTPEHLVEWLEDLLVPSMEHATTAATETASGEHCRWCPARFAACPQLMADMKELEEMTVMAEKVGAEALTNEQVANLLKLQTRAKIVFSAAEKTAIARIHGGGRIPDFKLVKGTGNRVWNDDAKAAAEAEFGPEAYTKPELKSPAAVDEMPKGKAFTSRYAFKPEKGLQLASVDDRRPEVSTDTKGLFTDVTAKTAAEPANDPAPEVPAVAKRRKKVEAA